jgi:glucokinase
MEEKWLIGVDIGGTTIKIAFISLSGDIICSWEIDTNISNEGKHIPASIARSIDENLKEFNQTKIS